MKRFTFCAIIMALVVGFASISFAVSDSFVKKEAEKVMLDGLKDIGVNDIIHSKTRVVIDKYSEREDGVLFVSLRIENDSKEHGPGVAAIYFAINKNGKIASKKYHLISLDEDDMSGFQKSLIEFQNLVKYHGDKTKFFLVTMN